MTRTSGWREPPNTADGWAGLHGYAWQRIPDLKHPSAIHRCSIHQKIGTKYGVYYVREKYARILEVSDQ